MQPLKWFCSHQSKRRKRSERVKKHAPFCNFCTRSYSESGNKLTFIAE
ncbi:hypothetical protein M8C21_011029 [Ambrosia artemisiifolia]|uniref:Uncharacterized protein n=1 Tax=Ambrosia artemisiifolia TaxID=4212 RepID=A0AAD5BYT7_AMBAR|nr:hypothetical protein M8C21_011029 [Ambrosia artemisiifolia]